MTNGEWISLGGLAVSLLALGVSAYTASMVYRFRSASIVIAVHAEQIKATIELVTALNKWGHSITACEGCLKRFIAEQSEENRSDHQKSVVSMFEAARVYSSCFHIGALFLPRSVMDQCGRCGSEFTRMQKELTNPNVGNPPDEAIIADLALNLFWLNEKCRRSLGIEGSLKLQQTLGHLDPKVAKEIMEREKVVIRSGEQPSK